MTNKKVVSDLKKIIQIQEKIIKKQENEHKMVHNLFVHYLNKTEEFRNKYIYHRKLWFQSVNDFDEFIRSILKPKKDNTKMEKIKGGKNGS
jgi:hypothetical protein